MRRPIPLRLASCALAASLALASAACAPGIDTVQSTCHYQQCVPVPDPLAVGLDSSIYVDWPTIQNVASYNIYYSTSPGIAPFSGPVAAGRSIRPATGAGPGPGPAKMAGVQPPLTLTGLSPNTQYFAVVTAVDATSHAESLPSPQLAVTTQTAGTGDTTFGTGGFAPAAGAAGGTQSVGNATAVDAQGRVVVAGWSFDGVVQHLGVWRFNPDGSADPTFGSAGAVFPPTAAGGVQDQGNAVAIDSQGRIVVVGQSSGTASVVGIGNTLVTYMAVWRFTPDGALDPGFSGAGTMITTGAATVTGSLSGFSISDVGNAVSVDRLDRIVVAGASNFSPGGGAFGSYVVLWRFNPDGSADTSLTDGTCQVGGITLGGTRSGSVGGCIALTGTAGSTPGDVGRSVAIDGQGRIVVAGISGTSAQQNMSAWRFTSNGVLDPSFGPNGLGFLTAGTLTSASAASGAVGFDGANAVTVDGHGQLVAVGSSSSRMVIWRFDANGIPDSLFTDSACLVNAVIGGCVLGVGASPSDSGSAAAIDRQGNILVAGFSSGASTGLTLWRYLPGGSPDPTWGGSGIVPVLLPATVSALAGSSMGVALDIFGRIVVGTTFTPSSGTVTEEAGVMRITP